MPLLLCNGVLLGVAVCGQVLTVCIALSFCGFAFDPPPFLVHIQFSFEPCSRLSAAIGPTKPIHHHCILATTLQCIMLPIVHYTSIIGRQARLFYILPETTYDIGNTCGARIHEILLPGYTSCYRRAIHKAYNTVQTNAERRSSQSGESKSALYM